MSLFAHIIQDGSPISGGSTLDPNDYIPATPNARVTDVLDVSTEKRMPPARVFGAKRKVIVSICSFNNVCAHINYISAGE